LGNDAVARQAYGPARENFATRAWGHDGGVGEDAAALDQQSGDRGVERHPAGIGTLGNQDLAVETGVLVGGTKDLDGTGHDPWAAAGSAQDARL